jgi:hypothetical protein
MDFHQKGDPMIHIQFEGRNAAQIRAEMLALLGSTALTAAVPPTPLVVDEAAFLGTDRRETFVIPEGHEAVLDVEGRATGETRPVVADDDINKTASEVSGAPTRERGKPSPGHKRRTNAEIAEDDAKDKAEAAYAAAHPEVAFALATADKLGEIAGISTGEERIGPEDDAVTAKQDAADEAAETAKAKAAAGGKLTLDDVRNALGVYVQKFGMEAAQEDGPKVLKLVCGDAITKISAIPDDQAIIAKVVAGIEELTAKNPFKRSPKAA